MNVLPFVFLLLSFSSFAQLNTGNGTTACVDADIITALNGGINEIECDSLNLTGPISTSDAITLDTPLIIRVKNSVTLSATSAINFAGQNAIDEFGAFSGLGGGNGGDNSLDGNGGGPFPGNGSGGVAGINGVCPNLDGLNDDSAEAGGGGGGTLRSGSNPGVGGVDIVDEGIVGTGGNPGPVPAFDPNSFTFAGSGGGGGGNGCENNIARLGGGGGGGGGGFQIVAGGNVIIDGNINVPGGNGFSGANFAGAGGGGSGGVVIIQTLGQLTISGTISAIAGSGGASLRNANGGVGSPGFIILQDADGSIACAGCSPGATTSATGSSSSTSNSKLTSDISCGTVMPLDQQRQNQGHQILVGFVLAMIAGIAARRLRSLKLFPYSQI